MLVNELLSYHQRYLITSIVLSKDMEGDFNSTMMDLIKACRAILDLNSTETAFTTKKERGKMGHRLHIKVIKNYETDFATINDEEDNKEDIIAFFQKYRVPILKGWKNDVWMRASNVCIYSGAVEPDEKRKIPLSAIYTLAYNIREKTKKNLNGFPIEAFAGHVELLYPTYLMLYIYRLLLFSLSGEKYGEEITKIGGFVVEIEKELNIKREGSKDIVSTDGDGMVDVITSTVSGLAKDFITKMGVDIPGDVNLTGEGGFPLGDMVSSFVKRPETGEIMSEISETLSGVNDMGEGLQKMFNKLQEPESIDRLKRLVGGFMPQETKEEEEVEVEE